MTEWLKKVFKTEEPEKPDALQERFEKHPEDFAQPTEGPVLIITKTRAELEFERQKNEIVESVRLVIKEEIEALRIERQKLEDVINELWGRTP